MPSRPFQSLLLALSCATLGAHAGSWPMFRGPNGSGVADDAQPPLAISPTNLVAWSAALPWSPSSPVVAGDRLYLTTFADGTLETRAFATTDGRLLWKHGFPASSLEAFHDTEGSPAASTPATDGTTVVSYFGSVGLVALDSDGRERWRQPMEKAMTDGNFGSGTSPIIAGDQVILCRDHSRGSAILSFDLKSGAPRWTTPRPESPTSYSTPVIWRHDGTEEIVSAGSLSMRGYDPATGAERWVMRGLPSYTCTTPVIAENLMVFAGWAPGKADSPWPTWESIAEKQDKNQDGWISPEEFADGPVWFKAQDIDSNGRLEKSDWDTIGSLMKRGENVLLAVRAGGRGDVTATHAAWKFTKGLPYVPCPIAYRGRVYLIKDGGMMSSFDARTGEPAYVQERIGAMGNYYASPVAADGRLYVASLQGVVTVVRAGGEKPEILHRAEFGERIAGTPALVGHRLYLRTQSKLYAFGSTPAPASP
ncbi:MAG: PQQ-binding-like beta-propeller repeat protein [Verrucomicrobiales bacterium]|nr:PQQ-binding-like beta-propeller repeat protein [Verrucomicrobiales bacterium]